MEHRKIEPKIGERKSSHDLKTYWLQNKLDLMLFEFDISEFIFLKFAVFNITPLLFREQWQGLALAIALVSRWVCAAMACAKGVGEVEAQSS